VSGPLQSAPRTHWHYLRPRINDINQPQERHRNLMIRRKCQHGQPGLLIALPSSQSVHFCHPATIKRDLEFIFIFVAEESVKRFRSSGGTEDLSDRQKEVANCRVGNSPQLNVLCTITSASNGTSMAASVVQRGSLVVPSSKEPTTN
jgi:hypothetical protein